MKCQLKSNLLDIEKTCMSHFLQSQPLNTKSTRLTCYCDFFFVNKAEHLYE